VDLDERVRRDWQEMKAFCWTCGGKAFDARLIGKRCGLVPNADGFQCLGTWEEPPTRHAQETKDD
jgi:hypothetical protein